MVQNPNELKAQSLGNAAGVAAGANLAGREINLNDLAPREARFPIQFDGMASSGYPRTFSKHTSIFPMEVNLVSTRKHDGGLDIEIFDKSGMVIGYGVGAKDFEVVLGAVAMMYAATPVSQYNLVEQVATEVFGSGGFIERLSGVTQDKLMQFMRAVQSATEAQQYQAKLDAQAAQEKAEKLRRGMVNDPNAAVRVSNNLPERGF